MACLAKSLYIQNCQTEENGIACRENINLTAVSIEFIDGMRNLRLSQTSPSRFLHIFYQEIGTVHKIILITN